MNTYIVTNEQKKGFLAKEVWTKKVSSFFDQ